VFTMLPLAPFAAATLSPTPRSCNESLTLKNIALSADTLMSFDAIDSPIACCDLCSLVEGCVAFTLVDGRCDLKDWITPLETTDGALSAFMHEFATEDDHHNPIVYTPMDGAALSSTPLEVYPVDDKEACSVLCSKYGYAPEPGSGSGEGNDGSGSGPEYSDCTAFTVINGQCSLYDALAPMEPSKGAVGGSMPNGETHYGNPWNGDGCLNDELKNVVGGVDGYFCSAACRGPDLKWCPPDIPAGIAAKPSCMIRDPVGFGYHCALGCSSDADCDTGATCTTAFGPGFGFCVYPTPAGAKVGAADSKARLPPAPSTATSLGTPPSSSKPAAIAKPKKSATPKESAKPMVSPKPTKPKESAKPTESVTSSLTSSLARSFAKAARGEANQRS